MRRRNFLKTSTLGLVTGLAQARTPLPPILGHGEFRYRIVPGWGVLGDKTPVNNCHGIVEDAEGHIILFTDHTDNNVIVYDKAGKLVHKWGTTFPGAHGLSIVREGRREVLYLTDLKRNAVFKSTLDGEMLDEWNWPETSGHYENAGQYRPSWTLHPPDGRFFVLDGYGKDFIQRISKDGKQEAVFGGQKGGIEHWGPHGGIYDDGLLIAMSDRQYLLKLDDDGREKLRIPLPGGNPRQIQRVGDHYYVAHLADNWPADRDSRGFLSILDKDFKVLSNPGGTAPEYDDDGKLAKMAHKEPVFLHPHDLVVDGEGSIYVAQFNSGNTYPIKLERI
ncbi:peptidylglycine monooxygenase [Haloferula helveola]|uniref:Peptidylglycine monooxygenase n=1 Tax=Haloferula helveola TaxID=490095 RepID=A0ABM7RF40_9BACT|nr:peptidylglycine monooxygenase [Haloferula helveola]